MKFFWIIISLCILTGMVIVYKKNIPSNNNYNNKSGSFTVGTVAGYAPFVSINSQGDYEGFDIDVAKSVAQALGKELIIKDMGSMSSLFIALEQGKIDAIIWALSITSDRLKKVAMVRYYGEDITSYPLMFWQKIPENITSLQDINNIQDSKISICVEPASSQDTVLSTYTSINKISTERVDDALLNIMYGKADAAFVEPAIAKKFKSKYPEIQILNVPLAPEDQVQGMGIAIQKDNYSLINQIEKVVSQLKASGILKTYATTWNIS